MEFPFCLFRATSTRYLEVFERKTSRKIFGPEKTNDKDYEIRNNKESEDVYDETTIVGTVKNMRLSWTGRVWRSEGLNG